MVQLEHEAFFVPNRICWGFQFHYGSIRTCGRCKEYGTFDVSIPLWSIMVQLEQCGLYFLNPVVMFQFHKGSIRTHKLAEYAAVSEFQFHKGAIRTPATLDASGKVTLFQFHYGSIRTDYSNAENGDYREFQFHKGSIRTT